MSENRIIKVMGIININDDSFYSGSRHSASEDFLETFLRMVDQGADIIDIGACSTRPGSTPISEKEEWKRLSKHLESIAGFLKNQRLASGSKSTGNSQNIKISIDTFQSGIIRKAFKVIGPFIVNDISAGENDPQMLSTVGELGLSYIAMHKRGTPDTMQNLTDYPDGVVAEVRRYFEEFAKKAAKYGIKDWILDPGFGFAKTVEQNYELLEHLDMLTHIAAVDGGVPVLVGLSRKSMIYKPLGITPQESLPATCVLNFRALQKGASILRVHDVKEAVQTVRLFERLQKTDVRHIAE